MQTKFRNLTSVSPRAARVANLRVSAYELQVSVAYREKRSAKK